MRRRTLVAEAGDFCRYESMGGSILFVLEDEDTESFDATRRRGLPSCNAEACFIAAGFAATVFGSFYSVGAGCARAEVALLKSNSDSRAFHAYFPSQWCTRRESQLYRLRRYGLHDYPKGVVKTHQPAPLSGWNAR